MKMNKTILEKGKNKKRDNQRNSFRCYVLYFFIYKKGKHQKWYLNTDEEILGGQPFLKMAEHVWMSAARMHADLSFDLWSAFQGLRIL